MTRILGIDPGSQKTGYGIIDMQGNRAIYVDSGHVCVNGATLPDRLRIIFEGVREIVAEYAPNEVAVEKVFMHRNVDSALKLGQARGAAICAALIRSLAVSEYTPTQIKQATVGKGNAAKTQVQHMVKVLLNLTEVPQADAADALAVALCHGHTRRTLSRMSVTGSQGKR